jgi:hypothetical protein
MNTSHPKEKGFFVIYDGTKVSNSGPFSDCISTNYDLELFDTESQMNDFIEKLSAPKPKKKKYKSEDSE